MYLACELNYPKYNRIRWLGSRVVSVLDSGSGVILLLEQGVKLDGVGLTLCDTQPFCSAIFVSELCNKPCIFKTDAADRKLQISNMSLLNTNNVMLQCCSYSVSTYNN